MIERITYGERKTHKLTFLFLFFYCHFYFAVTRDLEEKQGSASFFQREKPEFRPRFFSIFSIETNETKALKP